MNHGSLGCESIGFLWFNLTLILHSLGAEALYLPEIWQLSLTLTSPST